VHSVICYWRSSEINNFIGQVVCRLSVDNVIIVIKITTSIIVILQFQCCLIFALINVFNIGVLINIYIALQFKLQLHCLQISQTLVFVYSFTVISYQGFQLSQLLVYAFSNTFISHQVFQLCKLLVNAFSNTIVS
jgi:hypothetical protein